MSEDAAVILYFTGAALWIVGCTVWAHGRYRRNKNERFRESDALSDLGLALILTPLWPVGVLSIGVWQACRLTTKGED